MNKTEKILVTGANGFVGTNLVPFLANRGYHVLAAARRPADASLHPNITNLQMPDLNGPSADWEHILKDVDVIVHCAGVAHAEASDDIQNRINHLATAKPAEAATQAGVARFVLVSSILAQTASSSKKVLSEEDTPAPASAYGRAKLAGEKAVEAAGVPFTILRPVVIDGKNAKGNFGMLRRVARLPFPLPLGSFDAPRSFLSIANFNTAVLATIRSPHAIGKIYIIADPHPLSLKEIVVRIRIENGQRPNVFPFPQRLLAIMFWLAGRAAMWERIAHPLVVNTARLSGLLAEQSQNEIENGD